MKKVATGHIMIMQPVWNGQFFALVPVFVPVYGCIAVAPPAQTTK